MVWRRRRRHRHACWPAQHARRTVWQAKVKGEAAEAGELHLAAILGPRASCRGGGGRQGARR